MKRLTTKALLMILLSGCLFPISPLYYHFKSTSRNQKDSVLIVSYPGKQLEYRYQANGYDSVLIFDSALGIYKTMKFGDSYSYWKKEDEKAKKIDAIYFKKYAKGTIQYDTLCQVITPRAKNRSW